jgi:hypothetical protein
MKFFAKKIFCRDFYWNQEKLFDSKSGGEKYHGIFTPKPNTFDLQDSFEEIECTHALFPLEF